MTATTTTATMPTTTAPSIRTTGTRRSFLEGATAMCPWLVAVCPFGFVIGVTVAASSVSSLAGLATGITIYSGSAQLAAVELVGQGAAPAVAIAAVLAINARLIFYSGSMAVHWRGTSRAFRVLASYLLVDPSYAVGKRRYLERSEASGHAYYLGGAVTLWVAWQCAALAGYLASTGVPETLHLEYAVSLFLVAEVVRHARTRPTIAAAAVGAAVAVVGSSLPFHSGPLAGIAAGVIAGCAMAGRSR
jgi:predicted branched-subunit amino acid permease